jgi:hypothetical protein
MAKGKGRMAKEKAREDDNPFLEFVGVLGTFPGGADEINAWVEELRDDETKPSDQKAPKVKNSDMSG